MQGKPVDIGGYYHPDPAKCAAAMRPSATFNAVIDSGEPAHAAVAPRGTCWVMQWMLPPPSRISRPGTPTTRRSGKDAPQLRQRRRVGARVEQRHDDAAIGDVEVRIRGGQPFAGAARLGAVAMLHTGGLGSRHAQWAG